MVPEDQRDASEVPFLQDSFLEHGIIRLAHEVYQAD
jgi:hypothetical protein